MSTRASGDMRPPLILTKLKAPSDFGNLLLRPRLIDKLSQGMNYRLTLIHGSAGFGKTSLATQWRNVLLDRGMRVAWLSIDSEDNDLELCINYLVEAIRQAEPSIDVDTVALSESRSEQTAKFILTKLINQIDRCDEAIYFILDDWHLIHNEFIQNVLNFLIEYAPEHFHLIICSRNQPPLSLYTLQVKNQLLEIDVTDLRFNEEESSAFLRDINQLQLADEQVRKLWEKTDGWIASLQLVFLMLRSNHINQNEFIQLSEKLSENYSIGEYLTENVIDSLPQDTIDFLLQTSILDRLNGDLCNAVTQRQDSQVMLESLYKQGLFTRPLDPEWHWFQYHHLFADFLQRRLKRQQSNRLKSLHLSASEWFADAGQTDEAVRHALAAKDMERAIMLVEQHAMWLVEHSFMGTLLRLVDKLPAEKITSRCHLQMSIAWAHCLTHHQRRAQKSLDWVARALMRKDYPDAKNIRIEARVLQACIDIYADRLEEIETLLEPCFQDNVDCNPWVLVVAKNVMTYLFLHTYRYEEALQLQQIAQRYHQKTRGPFSSVYGDCFSGIALLEQCRLQGAEHYFKQALEKACERAGRHSHAAYLAGALLGQLYYERNQLDKAEDMLTGSRTLGVEGGVADFYIATYCFSSRLQILKKNFSKAYGMLNEGQDIARKLQIPRLDFVVKAELMKLHLLQGDTQSAQHLMQQWDESVTIMPTETPGIAERMFDIRERARARLLCQTGRYEQAINILSDILQESINNARQFSEIKIRTVLASVLNLAGDNSKAEHVLLPALLKGFEQQIIRTFLDADKAVIGVIERLYKKSRQEKGMLSSQALPDFSRWLNSLLTLAKNQENGVDRRAVETKSMAKAAEKLVEPLKAKEKKILTMLENGQTNKEIARNLNIGVDTVKWYLKSIYSKLGVSRRTQAVTEARKLDLL